jgi:heme/copper-type cytochrome/quinol oxidase subunit 2
MEDQFNSKKNPLVEWLKSWATKILLFTIAMLLLALISFIFESIGINIDMDDPADAAYNLFWLIIWTVSSISMLIVTFVVIKAWYKKYK